MSDSSSPDYPKDGRFNRAERKRIKAKKAIRKFKESKFAQASVAIGLASQNIASGILGFYGRKYGSDVIDTLRNNDLSFSEKAVTAAGQVVAVIPAYADLARHVVPIPHVQLFSSAAAMVGDFANYKKTRTSRNKHREKYISMAELAEAIKKNNYSETFYEHYQDYILKQPYIYNTLYEYRKTIITDSSLMPESRLEKIVLINKIIEGLANESDVSNDLKALEKLKNYFDDRFAESNALKDLDDSDKEHLSGAAHKVIGTDKLLSLIKGYEKSRHLFEQDTTTNSKLKSKMLAFHQKQKAIYSQDLPSKTKDMIFKFSESAKTNDEDASLIKASIENHFINQTSSKQIVLQDADLNQSISKIVLSQAALEKVEAFYKHPRVILDDLYKAKENLLSNTTFLEAEKTEQVLKLNDEIKRMTVLLATNAQEKNSIAYLIEVLKQMDPSVKILLASAGLEGKINKDIEALSSLQEDFNRIFSDSALKEGRDSDEVSQLKKSILMHREASLVQYSQAQIGQLQTPLAKAKQDKQIEITLEDLAMIENDVTQEVLGSIIEDKAFKKLAPEDQKQALQTRVTEAILRKLLGEAGLERYKMEQQTSHTYANVSKELQAYYRENFKEANEFIEGIYNRDILESSTELKSRILVGDAAQLALSTAGAILTPVVPASLALGVAGSAVGVIGLVDNLVAARAEGHKEEQKVKFVKPTTASRAKEAKDKRLAEKKKPARKADTLPDEDLVHASRMMSFSKKNEPAKDKVYVQSNLSGQNAINLDKNKRIFKLLQIRQHQIEQEGRFSPGHDARSLAIKAVMQMLRDNKEEYISGRKIINLDEIEKALLNNPQNKLFIDKFKKGIQAQSTLAFRGESRYAVLKREIQQIVNEGPAFKPKNRH